MDIECVRIFIRVFRSLPCFCSEAASAGFNGDVFRVPRFFILIVLMRYSRFRRGACSVSISDIRPFGRYELEVAASTVRCCLGPASKPRPVAGPACILHATDAPERCGRRRRRGPAVCRPRWRRLAASMLRAVIGGGCRYSRFPGDGERSGDPLARQSGAREAPSGPASPYRPRRARGAGHRCGRGPGSVFSPTVRLKSGLTFYVATLLDSTCGFFHLQ